MISMISAITMASSWCSGSAPSSLSPAKALESSSATIGRHVFSLRSKNSRLLDLSSGCALSPDPSFLSITTLIFCFSLRMSCLVSAKGSTASPASDDGVSRALMAVADATE